MHFYCRGFTEEDFEQVVEFFDRAVAITGTIKGQSGSKIKDFKAALASGPDAFPELVKLRDEVTQFSRKFPTVGF